MEARTMKVMWNGREVEIPPKIEALLKKRGWTFPPTEEMKRSWREAAERFDGSLHTGREVLEELAKEDRVLYHILQIKKEQQEREKEKSCKDACAAPELS
jgi:hypothetical protein